MSDKSSKQAALPMGTTPAPSDRVTVTIGRDVAEMVADMVALYAKHGDARPFDEVIDLLMYVAGDAVDLARNLMPRGADGRETLRPAPEASKIAEASPPARTGGALIGEVARKIAEHTIACGAGFWAGGVPEVRSALGIDADGQTIAAAFRRIERGQVAGVGATQCPQNHRAGGSYALWTVTVAPKKTAA
jgi:hypothetical protein